MIETENITEFKQLFDYIPKSVIGKLLRTNNPRMNRLRLKVDELTIHEIVAVSDAINIEHTKMLDIIFRQYFNDHKKKK